MILSKYVESISIVGRKVNVVMLTQPWSGPFRDLVLCEVSSPYFEFATDPDTTQRQVERYDATSVSGALNVWRPGHCLWCRCNGC